MKKIAVALAILGGLCGHAAAQSSVTIFGIRNGDKAAISLPGGPAGLRIGDDSKGFEVGFRHSF